MMVCGLVIGLGLNANPVTIFVEPDEAPSTLLEREERIETGSGEGGHHTRGYRYELELYREESVLRYGSIYGSVYAVRLTCTEKSLST